MRLQHIIPLLTLRAAYYLADFGYQDVHSRYRLFVIVNPHIEGLDFFGIVGDDHRALEGLFGQVTLMLCLNIGTPLDRKLEILLGLFKKVNRLGIGDMLEIGIDNMFQSLDNRFINPLVEKGHFVGTFFQSITE